MNLACQSRISGDVQRFRRREKYTKARRHKDTKNKFFFVASRLCGLVLQPWRNPPIMLDTAFRGHFAKAVIRATLRSNFA